MKIGIVGSTGQIGRSLVLKAEEAGHEVLKYSRSLCNIPRGFVLQPDNYPGDIEMIINCIGKGNPGEAYYFNYDDLNDFLDTDIHILNRKKIWDFKYVYISSWVADLINVANVKRNYAVMKRFIELRHELFNFRYNDNVKDIRVSSFFSRFFNMNSGFLIASILRNILEGAKLEIINTDELFEYVTPSGLFNSIINDTDLSNTYVTRHCLYEGIKSVVFGQPTEYLSREFQDELNILLGVYYAKNPEKVDNILVGPVSYKDEPIY